MATGYLALVNTVERHLTQCVKTLLSLNRGVLCNRGDMSQNTMSCLTVVMCVQVLCDDDRAYSACTVHLMSRRRVISQTQNRS